MLTPVLIWLGLGNLVSVLLPVSTVPLLERWRRRRDPPSTARWLLTLAVPYALCSVMDPMTDLPELVVDLLGPTTFAGAVEPAAVLLIGGLAIYAALTGTALGLARVRRRQLHDLTRPTVVTAHLVLAA